MRKLVERIRDDTIFVDGNIISYKHSFVCVDNISMMTIRQNPPSNLWILGLIILLFGIPMLFFSLFNRYYPSTEAKITVIFSFIILVGIGVLIIYLTVRSNKNRPYHLVLELNSGGTLWFAKCDRNNLDFLDSVINCFTKSINEGRANAVKIDFANCQIAETITVNNQKRQNELNRSYPPYHK